jgi:SAM-dependent MidA family methyltransferase
MPARLVVHEAGKEWQEKQVALAGDDFVFVTKQIGDERLRDHLRKIPVTENVRFETEVNLAALDWIESVAQKLTRGFILAVDYGYPRAEFYAAERTAGTLQAFARHRPVASPLDDAGSVDITTHVDWTTLAERAEEAGLNLIGFTDQHHFLTGLLGRYSPADNERRALQTLLHPEFLGTRFQYLGLGRNVPAGALSGFRFAREPRRALGLA